MYDLRTKYSAVVHYLNVDKNFRRVSQKYGVSKSTLGRWILYDRSNGSLVRRNRKNRQTIVQSISSEVQRLVQHNPYMSISMIQSKLTLKTSVSSVQRCLKALNMSYKATSRTRKGQPVDLSHPFFPAYRSIYMMPIIATMCLRSRVGS